VYSLVQHGASFRSRKGKSCRCVAFVVSPCCSVVRDEPDAAAHSGRRSCLSGCAAIKCVVAWTSRAKLARYGVATSVYGHGERARSSPSPFATPRAERVRSITCDRPFARRRRRHGIAEKLQISGVRLAVISSTRYRVGGGEQRAAGGSSSTISGSGMPDAGAGVTGSLQNINGREIRGIDHMKIQRCRRCTAGDGLWFLSGARGEVTAARRQLTTATDESSLRDAPHRRAEGPAVGLSVGRCRDGQCVMRFVQLCSWGRSNTTRLDRRCESRDPWGESAMNPPPKVEMTK